MRRLRRFFSHSGLLIVLILSVSTVSSGQFKKNNLPTGNAPCISQDNGAPSEKTGISDESCKNAYYDFSRISETVSVMIFSLLLIGISLAIRHRFQAQG